MSAMTVRILYFMFLVDFMLSLEDIDEYKGFAYSSFNGPVSGDVEPVYLSNPLVPGQTLVDYTARPDYRFAYGVSDPDTGNSQRHQESRDGDAVKGEYSLIEPDGYIRRVIYSADATHGFQATVIYEPPSGAVTAPSLSAYSQPNQIRDEFPYEQIMNSIPDIHDIPIPRYERVEAVQNIDQFEADPANQENYDLTKTYPSETADGDDSNVYDSSNLVKSDVGKILEPIDSSLRGGPNGDSNLFDGSNLRRTSTDVDDSESTRTYDSAEVTQINNMFDPQAESIDY